MLKKCLNLVSNYLICDPSIWVPLTSGEFIGVFILKITATHCLGRGNDCFLNRTVHLCWLKL